MIYKMTLKDSADEMTFDLLEVPIVDKDIEGAVDNVTLDGNQYTDYLWLKKQFTQKWSILCDDEYTRLRGFYTRQFENADVPSYRLYYGDDIIRNSTLSGEYIQFSVEGVADGTMSLTQMDGNATQDGTPTPSAPVPIQTVTGRQTVGVIGKNLLPIASPTRTSARAGVTITLAEDGLITLNGTATGNSWADLIYGIQNNTTTHSSCYLYYTQSNVVFSAKVVGGTKTTSTGGVTVAYNDTETQAAIPFSDMTQQKTTSTTNGINRAYIYIANGSVFNNYSFYLQVEKGSQATAYEPYQGQTLPVNLGKNLFDNSASATWNHGSTSVSSLSNGVRVSQIDSGTYRASGWVICRAEDFIGKTISLSAKMTPSSSNKGAMYIAFSDATGSSRTILKTGTSSGSISATISSVDQTKPYIAVALYSNYDGTGSNGCYVDYSELQLELGSATDYAPYFTPIELAKIGNYQDRIYKEDSKWYIEKQVGKVVLDGTEDGWTWADTTRYAIATANIGAREAISDHFTYVNYAGHSTTASPSFDISSNLASIGFHDKDITSLNNFKTWLASNPTTVYYPLATPTTTEIANEALVEQLEALVDEAISVGQHNIYTDTPNALPTLTFDLTEYLSKSTTIIPETAVRLTLTDGGVINACGCRKDVQLTMRETIE